MTADEPVATPTAPAAPILSGTSSPKGFRPWSRHLLRLPEAVSPRSEETRELRAPCKGGGFDFSVSIMLIWTALEGKSRWSLSKAIDYHEEAVWETIEATVRLVARCYPPDQAIQVEEVLADKLSCVAQEWRPVGFRRGDAKWKVWLGVEAHEEVKKLQQRFWLERLDQDAQMKFSQSQVTQLRDLTSQWRLYLGDLNVDDPNSDKKPAPYLAQYLARLAVEPSKTPDTMKRLAEDLEGQHEELLKVVKNAVEGNQKTNTYEFLQSYESALLLLMKHVGAQPVELGKDIGYGGSDIDLDPMARNGSGDAASG
ncbi:MAG: hypothetical protein ACRD0K_03295 [Egibacteraceae bacterium]